MKAKTTRLWAVLLTVLAACTPASQPPRPPQAGDPQPCALPAPPAPALLPRPPGSADFIPQAPQYPYFSDRDAVIAQARCLSDALESYVKAWLDGKADARLPEAFLPPGHNQADYGGFRLVRYEDIRPEAQWAVRPAEAIDFARLRGFFPDVNVTYIVMPHFYAPFGSRLVIEGEFPRSRFFNIQVTPSFQPENYRYDGGVGVAEVPLVDADIEPLPGSTNPFRVGANRNAAERRYRVGFDLAVGDPVALNPAFRPPNFRAPGNRRVGGAISYQGPWGSPAAAFGHRRGVWDFGQVWIRYYAPDKAAGALGGVPLPKAYYQLPDGRRFFIQADLRGFTERANRRYPATPTAPIEPRPENFEGPDSGWFKQLGIFRAVVGGLALESKWAPQRYVRELDKGVAGRGEDLPAPHNYEQSATSATYVDYLVRGMSLGSGKIVVLTGRLPTFPQTRNGEAGMGAAQMRYWSLTGYEVPTGWDFLRTLDPNYPIGLAVQSLMDDEIALNANRQYVIVLSRPQDRPANATAANGVTWRDWGPASKVSWTLRWMSVKPEWNFERTPSPPLVGFNSDWASTAYDQNVIGRNGHGGALGEYLPRLHYLTRPEFEALGSNLAIDRIPVWR